MSDDPCHLFVPKHTTQDRPITPQDAHMHVIVESGSMSDPMLTSHPVSLGQTYTYRKDSSGWEEFAYCPQDDGDHWVDFNGYRVIVDIDIRQHNRRRTHDWKGYDEIKGSTSARISFNGAVVDEVGGVDLSAVLQQVDQHVKDLMHLDPLMRHLAGDRRPRFSLVGRPIYYHDQAATIVRYVEGQACVIIQPEPGYLPAPWQTDGYDHGEPIKDTVLSPHIWWYRDPIEGWDNYEWKDPAA